MRRPVSSQWKSTLLQISSPQSGKLVDADRKETIRRNREGYRKDDLDCVRTPLGEVEIVSVASARR
jgi:hypothetical protein